MSAPWRLFERLIAQIEQVMAPSGAVVRSPDRIPDRLTGELREVDASLRYRVGTSPVLITIECRDRSNVEDVRWIEQLVEKKRSIGASITVAVSSSGFSEPAIRKASVSGIEVRTLTEASAKDFVQWLRLQNVVVDSSGWSLVGLAFSLYDFPDDAELIEAAQTLLRDKGPLAPILIRNSDGRRFHIQNILIEWQKRNGTFFPDDLPPDGSKILRNLYQPLERNCLHVETTRGNFDIAVIHVAFSFSRSIRQVPISRLTEYSDPSSVIVQTAAWKVIDGVKLSLHRDVKSGETRFRVTSEGEP
jgi:hypothetical protein